MLCGRHFRRDDFILGQYPSVGLHRKVLKKDAVPSLFFGKKNKDEKENHPIFDDNDILHDSSSPLFSNSHSNPVFTNHNNVDVDSFNCENLSSPKTRKLKQIVKMKNKKIKRLQKKVLRQARTIKGLMATLDQKSLISKELAEILGNNFGHIDMALFKNECRNKNLETGSRYSKDIKEFAISLHLYSPRAYKFVRKTLHLPHPATLRSWAGNVVCEPGFLSNVISSVSAKLPLSGETECALILDEMSIRKDTQWDKRQSKFVGNVDYGKIKGEDSENIATNVLVVMAVGLKSPWQRPIAYFLTNKTNSEIQAQIIKKAIILLYEENVVVKSVTFDGPTKNIATARKLGCNIDDLQGSFPHPCRPDLNVYIILDICHMLKLARNALGDMNVFVTPKEEKISWEFIKALYDIQQQDILHIGNKLKTKHIQWQKHKMKVSIAAQTLSESVAAAITFLRENGNPNFKDSKATSDFILLMNNLFDILNSKSKFGMQFKAPVTTKNYEKISSYLTNGVQLLTSLTDLNGLKIVIGPRKTFIQGFAISIKSILAITKDLLQRSNSPYEFVLTYKFSQDPLEMFFSKIRGRLGWNNNPNALQFKYALRSLLLANKIDSPSTANCTPVENENDAVPDATVSDEQDKQVSNMLIASTTWRPDVLFNISGYISNKLSKKLRCTECAVALFQPTETTNQVPQASSLLT